MEGIVTPVVVEIVADSGDQAAEDVDRRGRELAQRVGGEKVVEAVGHVGGVLGVVVRNLLWVGRRFRASKSPHVSGASGVVWQAPECTAFRRVRGNPAPRLT